MKYEDHEALTSAVTELLGFRVAERENDAVVVGPSKAPSGKLIRPWVRPATQQEVIMYLRVLGLVARTGELTTALDAGVVTISKQATEIDVLKAARLRLEQEIIALTHRAERAEESADECWSKAKNEEECQA